ncbi:MAG: hypothetical protein Q7V05_02170 [Methanoregula sp.]|nr:hypothetical protein [Methanoregula sp.]
MAPDSRHGRIPVELQILLGFCILAILILAPILLRWYLPGSVPASQTNATVHVKILAINDFHGQLPPGQTLNKRPVGSAPGRECARTGVIPEIGDGVRKC